MSTLTIAISGPDGSGKTTLANLLSKDVVHWGPPQNTDSSLTRFLDEDVLDKVWSRSFLDTKYYEAVPDTDFIDFVQSIDSQTKFLFVIVRRDSVPSDPAYTSSLYRSLFLISSQLSDFEFEVIEVDSDINSPETNASIILERVSQLRAGHDILLSVRLYSNQYREHARESKPTLASIQERKRSQSSSEHVYS